MESEFQALAFYERGNNEESRREETELAEKQAAEVDD